MTEIGSAFVAVRPQVDEAAFTQQVSQAVDRAGSSATSTKAMTPRVNTGPMEDQMNGAFARMGERFKATLTYSATYFAARSIVDQISDAFSTGSDVSLLESRAKTLFGAQSGAVEAFAQGASKNFDATKAEALNAAVAFQQFFEQTTNLAPTASTDLGEFFTSLAGKAAFLVPALGGVEGATNTLLRAVETGSSRGLYQLGLHFTTADIQAEALAMGLIKPAVASDKVTIAMNNVKIAQDEVAKASVGGIATAQQLADAHTNVELATTRYHETLKKGPANTIAAVSANKTMNDAIAREQALRAGGPDPDAILRAQNSLISAQDALAKATDGTLPPLDDQQRALATIQYIKEHASTIDQQYTDAQGTTAQAAKDASLSWEEAKQNIVNRVLPTITGGLVHMASFLDDHQGDFQSIGDKLKIGFEAMGSVFHFIGDHEQAFKDILLTLGGLWAVDKVIGYKTAMENMLGDTDRLYNRTVGKWFPNLFGKKTIQVDEKSSGPAGMRTISQMTVTEMTVESMIGGGAIGGAGSGAVKEGGVGAVTTAEKEAAIANESGVIAAAEGSAVVASSRTAGMKAALSGAFSQMGSMIGGAALAAPFVTAMFDFAAAQGWISSANPLRAIDDAQNTLNANASGNYGGKTLADQLNLTVQNVDKGYGVGDFRFGGKSGQDVMQQALGSDAVKNIVLSGDAAGLGNLAALAKSKGWDDMDRAYSALASAAEHHSITSKDQYDLFVKDNFDAIQYQDDLTRQIMGGTKTLSNEIGLNYAATQAEFDKMWEILVELPRQVSAQARGFAASDRTGAGAVHKSDPSGGLGYQQFALGGPVRETGPALVHKGEMVLTSEDQASLLQMLRSSGGGYSGLNLRDLHIYNPATEVDVLTAMERFNEHQFLSEVRGVQPAPGYAANLQIGG